MCPLSVNKQAFLNNPFPYYSDDKSKLLSIGEIARAVEHLNRKHGIQIYVQNNLPCGPQDSKKSSILRLQGEIAWIRSSHQSNEAIGYVFTADNLEKSIQDHVECLIFWEGRIYKPVHWPRVFDSRRVDFSLNEDVTHTVMKLITPFFCPQGDIKSCGAICLKYLKELLKHSAEQLKKWTFIFSCSYPGRSDRNPLYFFVPSPQCLRYSQSTEFNTLLAAMVANDKTANVNTKKGVVQLTPLVALLKPKGRKGLQEIEKFRVFREAWMQEYNKAESKRSLMNHPQDGQNLSLDYALYRFHVIPEATAIR
ncbi:MAG: hypothetical protein RLZZ453_68 [Chlamydiota bacterium]|jgi:hypothetical protein